jgi:hypothetical protein
VCVICYHLSSVVEIDFAAGNLIQKDVRTWFSPQDQAVKYDIARGLYLEGTATWLFEVGVFKEWELIGSLLWIHGRRTLLLIFTSQPLIVPRFRSGLGKEHPVVCRFLLIS